MKFVIISNSTTQPMRITKVKAALALFISFDRYMRAGGDSPFVSKLTKPIAARAGITINKPSRNGDAYAISRRVV